ncbi:Zinc finger protein HD1 [Platanthera guangdongensis]|uniref:Zinc finger protein HD1 n=1 Tax=Platanthera guangdongensis TaxID=2320717 RepID=A0ABR2LF42_9ASPA
MEIESCDFGRLLCEICEQALATVSCKADAAVLCSECDLDVHSANHLAFRHERLPIFSIFDRASDLLFDDEEDSQPNELGAGEPPAEIRSTAQPFFEERFWQIENVLAPIINDAGEIDFGSVSSSYTAAAPDRRWKSTSSETAVATDREARVMRYREKRKNRRFGRTIRYASRKACAEARPRIKGRFAKRRDSKVEFGQISSTCFDQFFGFRNWTGH